MHPAAANLPAAAAAMKGHDAAFAVAACGAIPLATTPVRHRGGKTHTAAPAASATAIWICSRWRWGQPIVLGVRVA